MYEAVPTIKNSKKEKQRCVSKKTAVMAASLVSLAVAATLAAVICCSAGETADPADGTELVFAMMVHRHGDRTPNSEKDLLVVNLDNDEVKAVIQTWGYGQLTDAGIKTAHKTGEFIRRRYDGHIASKFNESEIYIYSTDVTRTKVTCLTAMAAVYPPAGGTWFPAPYTTKPAQNDSNQVWSSCPIFLKNLVAKINTPFKVDKYQDMITKLACALGNEDFGVRPFNIITAHDVITSLTSIGYDLGEETMQLYDALTAASDDMWDYFFGEKDTAEMVAGVYLNDFITYANEVISGKDTQRVRVYSAHDINIYTLEAITHVNRQGAPKYGSLFSLELRKVVETGQYVVLPVYLSDPHEGVEKFLQIEGCSALCPFEQFTDLTAQYRLDEDSWKTKCNEAQQSL